MAIKIDLLPRHVKLRRNLQKAILGSALALALVGTGLVMALDAKQKELQTAQTDLGVVTAVAAQTAAAQTAQTTAEATMKPVSDTVAFMLASSKSGPQRAALINQVRQYIYTDTIVNSIDLSDGKTVKINATVKDPRQYAQFLFNLRRAGPPPPGATTTDAGPLFSAAPVGTGPGGFNNGNTVFLPPPTPTDQPVIVIYPLKVEATGPLKYPIPVLPDPSVSATAGAPGAAGATGAPGALGAPITPISTPGGGTSGSG